MKLIAVQFKDSHKVEWITDDPDLGDVYGATVLYSIPIVAPKKKVVKEGWVRKDCIGETFFPAGTTMVRVTYEVEE